MAAPRPGRVEPTRLVGPDAINGLAIRFRMAPPDDPIHRQADDLWQALRQRELVVAAAEADPELVPPAVRDHWRRAVAGWRRIVPPLMQARSRAGSGPPVDPRQLADAVAAVELCIEINRPSFRSPFAMRGLDVIADNGSNAGLVLGPAVPDWRKRDLAAVAVVFRMNGAELARGTGAAAMPIACSTRRTRVSSSSSNSLRRSEGSTPQSCRTMSTSGR